MAPLKAGWLSHVIMYLVCLVSTVGIGGGRREKTKAPQKPTKIKRICSFNFCRFFEVVSYVSFSDKKPIWSSATQAKKWNIYGSFFNCESTAGALGIYFLFLSLYHIYLVKENTSLNGRGKNKRYFFIFMCERLKGWKVDQKKECQITF